MDTPTNQTALIPVEQDMIMFYGHELMAVRLADGRIAVALRWLFESLDLERRGQMQRIERKAALRDGLISVEVMTAGGPQNMQALTLDVLPGYLFTIDENRVKPEAKPDIILFQRECVKVLADHFAHKHGAMLPALAEPRGLAPVDPRLTGQVAQLAEQIDQLTSVVMFLREHLEAQLTASNDQVGALSERLDDAVTLLESLAERQAGTGGATTEAGASVDRPRPLTPAHARAIQEQVDRMVVETQRAGAPLSHIAIYGKLARIFKANSYREIADSRYEEVLDFLFDELSRALAE